MPQFIATALLLVVPALAIAEDHLPTPDYHQQPSDPAWLAPVVQLHGHLGPSVVAGARMGMIGRDAVGAKGYFDVEVTCDGPLAQPPQACFLDGIQAATGATTGKRTLNWVQADNLVVRVRNTQNGKTAELRPTPALMELLASFKAQPKAGVEHGPGEQDHERLEAIARKIAVMPDSEVATVTLGGELLPDGKPLATASVYMKWHNGPSQDTKSFPIAVWLQDPHNVPKYQAIGINLFVGLWEGPTAEQIAELKRHGMPVICEQNEYALKHLDEKTIVGWMHGDEPDNAQSLPGGKGYGPPIQPEKILQDYQKIRANDPSRPVMLNLGQGVAWDDWYGRGVRTNHPEDYAEYVRGGDIISFDIYPAVHDNPAIAGKLWYVARGVNRLRKWAGSDRIIWNCIECTRISNAKTKPTPEQVKAEVWMSIIHGSQGLVYFCHQFQPKFIEAGLLADEEMAKAVGAINREVQGLAEVINSPALAGAATVTASPPEVSPDMARLLGTHGISAAARKYRGVTYLFAVRMENSPAKGKFQITGMSGKGTIRVIGEDRVLPTQDGRFDDSFAPHAVHLYQVVK